MHRDIVLIVIITGFLIFGGILIWRKTENVLPERSNTSNVAVVDTDDEIDASLINLDAYKIDDLSYATSNKKIFVTDGVKHSVALDRIVDGGPPKDGIPAITNPQFESVGVADSYLRGSGLGIAIDDGKVERFYPFQILTWHEIVNDVVSGVPVAITYCPLCGTAIAYERIVNGVVEEFGVSGKLFDSNMLMYDKSTNSYWSQALGEAVYGEMTGSVLPLYQYFENVTWDEWKKAHPDGEVLSKNTGYVRDYTREPYGNYAETSALFFPVQNDDSRLPRKELIVGLLIDGIAKAYQISLFDDVREVYDVVNGMDVLITKNVTEGIRGYIINERGEKIKIPLILSFWFSWAASHPATELYK